MKLFLRTNLIWSVIFALVFVCLIMLGFQPKAVKFQGEELPLYTNLIAMVWFATQVNLWILANRRFNLVGETVTKSILVFLVILFLGFGWTNKFIYIVTYPSMIAFQIWVCSLLEVHDEDEHTLQVIIFTSWLLVQSLYGIIVYLTAGTITLLLVAFGTGLLAVVLYLLKQLPKFIRVQHANPASALCYLENTIHRFLFPYDRKEKE